MEASIPRLLCEGWLEKVLFSTDQSSLKPQQCKWKTRYALLVLQSSDQIRILFHMKKPKVYTEITDEIVTICPWRYTVDMINEGKDRSHVVRIKVFDRGFVTPASIALKLSMQYSEEALAWTRCIQGLTKLTSGIQGHTFSVLVCSTSSSESIGVAERHCILHIASEAVTLALKSDHTVTAVWPLSSVRSYAIADLNHFTIISGRRSPMGEGTFTFQTMEGDCEKVFSLLDHYTGVASASMLTTTSKPVRPKTSSTTVPTKSQPFQKSHATPVAGKARERFPTSPPPPSKPPRKPPLPKGRSFTVVGAKGKNEQAVHGSRSNAQKAAMKELGLYDLDKLLYTLEGNLRDSKSNPAGENVEKICQDLLGDILDKIEQPVSVHATENTKSSDANQTPAYANICKKPAVNKPKPKRAERYKS